MLLSTNYIYINRINININRTRVFFVWYFPMKVNANHFVSILSICSCSLARNMNTNDSVCLFARAIDTSFQPKIITRCCCVLPLHSHATGSMCYRICNVRSINICIQKVSLWSILSLKYTHAHAPSSNIHSQFTR